jgi:2'-5' RNA ligase
MGITSDCSSPNSLLAGKQFALVSYLPDPLAQFLDDLRLELVPDCSPRAHVTILPPRRILGTPEGAFEEIQEMARHFNRFKLRLGEITQFPISHVVYIEIAGGREKLLEMYRAMNSGMLRFQEAYPYCPHITLAQRIPPEEAQSAVEKARSAWKACQFSRSFPVETLHFVESDDGKCWRDLGEISLDSPSHFSGPPAGAPTRTNPAAPLCRV